MALPPPPKEIAYPLLVARILSIVKVPQKCKCQLRTGSFCLSPCARDISKDFLGVSSESVT